MLGPPGRLLDAIRPVQLATPRAHMTADFGAVYATQRDRLVRALSMSLGDDALATEAVDEAFTRALHRWHAVGSFDEPQAWIYRTARNWANSRFRRRSRDRRFAPKIAQAESTIDQPADPQLADALAGLSADQRNVLVLRYYLDWSIDATADALDVSAGTVKSRTNRALTELNRILGDRR
jgi:RNA polymerase sigma factor (sigma-70 family)